MHMQTPPVVELAVESARTVEAEAVFDRILVGTDGGTLSTWAASYAMRLADLHGADLNVVHVVPPRVPGESCPHALRAWRNAEAYERGRAVLGQLSVRAAPRRRVCRTLIKGRPVECLVETARTWPADLIVVGHHGRHAVEGVSGGVAVGVIHDADVPVLCVGRPPLATFGRRVLVAIDFDDAWPAAMARAAAIARRAGGELRVTHALRSNRPVPVDGALLDALVCHDCRSAVERLIKTAVANVPDGVPARCVVRSGPAASAQIVAAASEWSADLLVIGRRRPAPSFPAQIGRTTQAVLRQADCPVLCVGASG